jgi:hypothetical protein
MIDACLCGRLRLLQGFDSVHQAGNLRPEDFVLVLKRTALRECLSTLVLECPDIVCERSASDLECLGLGFQCVVFLGELLMLLLAGIVVVPQLLVLLGQMLNPLFQRLTTAVELLAEGCQLIVVSPQLLVGGFLLSELLVIFDDACSGWR